MKPNKGLCCTMYPRWYRSIKNFLSAFSFIGGRFRRGNVKHDKNQSFLFAYINYYSISAFLYTIVHIFLMLILR